MTENKLVDVVVIEFKDRLTRFGFEYLKRYFVSHSIKIEVVEETEKGYMDESIEDFVSIVISFAGRIYGKRSQKFRKIKRSWKKWWETMIKTIKKTIKLKLISLTKTAGTNYSHS